MESKRRSNLIIDDVKRRPESIFDTPRGLIRPRMIRRTGRSYQPPAGGAIYFDAGVIEVAAPMVELQAGCCFRATRLLWEQLRFVRKKLDCWSARNKCHCRLEGFSTFTTSPFQPRANRTRNWNALAYLLAHILPASVLC